MALRPSRAVVHETAEKGKLIVLRDRSGSMAVADGRGGETRAGQMDAAWEKALAAAPEVGQLLELAEYDFGDRLAHNGADVGEATAVGDVLSSALRAERGAKLHGVILLSDGRNTAGRDPLPALAPYIEAGIPIHTAQFGRAEFAAGIVDAVVTDVLVPPVVEAGKPFPINISGLIRGAEGRSCQLECLVDDKRVADRRIQCETADEKVKQRLMLPAINEPGFYLVTLRLVPLPGEISPDNNEMQVFVRVKEEGIQVLYLEASINPQYKFLRRLISADEGFTLESPSPFYLRTKRGIAEVQGLDLSAYNVIILGGIAPETLTANQWRRLPSLVKNRGAGLLAIGSTFNDLLDDRLRPLQSILPVRANDSTLEHREFAPKVVGCAEEPLYSGGTGSAVGLAGLCLGATAGAWDAATVSDGTGYERGPVRRSAKLPAAGDGSDRSGPGGGLDHACDLDLAAEPRDPQEALRPPLDADSVLAGIAGGRHGAPALDFGGHDLCEGRRAIGSYRLSNR